MHQVENLRLTPFLRSSPKGAAFSLGYSATHYLFFFFFAEKESKSMCLSVKKRFRRQEPAVWVSERERESKENLILLNSRHDCWNFCFFPLQHHEASVFFFPIQHILVLFLFLFLFFGHYIFRWPLILFNLPSCSASYCILLLHSYVPAAGGSIPQCPTVCSALRLLAASHCPSSLYNSNTLEPPTDIFSFKKEKKYFLRLGSISFDNCFFFFFFFILFWIRRLRQDAIPYNK